MKKHLQNNNPNYLHWLLSLIGACIIALGIGIWLAPYLQSYFSYFIVIGVIIHGWGMYKMYN